MLARKLREHAPRPEAARIAPPSGNSAASLPYLPKANRQAAKAYCGIRRNSRSHSKAQKSVNSCRAEIRRTEIRRQIPALNRYARR